MCVAAEGTVLSVKDRDAVVDFHGNEVTSKCGLVQVKPRAVSCRCFRRGNRMK